MTLLFSFFKDTNQVTADAFLSEKEAVVKDLGINLLNLVFFDQVGELLGNLAGV
ncbi:Uncharacterised protein [Streptococcus pneumoniae]|nr:Uncharacterised protein [Streptococcus pneumoniae]CAG5926897.1 Uncharacterised protein [Streptococcus pneumoniae]CAG5953216.1 Uncharacterised protein [Streptococcus pneumoniae]CAG5957315.1 Uncharacterised protein [Streptococcus pneumoniae]CEY15663.1 Uncharacterised protein [Streptococcus pneumoniae]